MAEGIGGDVLALLMVELGINTEKFAKGLIDSAKEMGTFGQVMAGVGIGGVIAFAAVTVAVTATAIAMAEAAEHAIEYAHSIEIGAAKMQISTTAAQELSFAAGTLGMSLDDIAGAASKMEKSLGQGSAATLHAVRDLGLNFTQLRNESPDKALSDIAAALAKVDNPSRLAADATALLGRGYAAMLPLLKDLAADKQLAHDVGAVVDPADLQATADMGKELRITKMAWDGLIDNFMSAALNSKLLFVVVKALTDAIADASKYVQAHRDHIRSLVADGVNLLIDGLKILMYGAYALIDVFRDLLLVWDSAVSNATKLAFSLDFLNQVRENPLSAKDAWQEFKDRLAAVDAQSQETRKQINGLGDGIQAALTKGIVAADQLQGKIKEIGSQKQVEDAGGGGGVGNNNTELPGAKAAEAAFKRVQNAIEKLNNAAETEGMNAYDKKIAEVAIKVGDVTTAIQSEMDTLQKNMQLTPEWASKFTQAIDDVKRAGQEMKNSVISKEMTDQAITGVNEMTKATLANLQAQEALSPSMETENKILAIQNLMRDQAEDKLVREGHLTHQVADAVKAEADRTQELIEKKKELDDFDAALSNIANTLSSLGGGGAALGGIVGGIGGLSKGLGGLGGLSGIGSMLSGPGGIFGGGGNDENGNFVSDSMTQTAMKAIGALSKAIPLASAAFGIAKSIASLFGSKPEYEQVAEELGKKLGADISEATAKAIEATESKDHVTRAIAEVLNVDKIITDAGLTEKTFAMVGSLMTDINVGAVNAKEGMAELDKVFTQIAQDSPQAAIAIIKQAEALKELTPAMQAYLDTQHALEAQGASEIGSGLSMTDPAALAGQWGTDAATFFVGGFQQAIQTNGLIPALDSEKKSLDSMWKTFSDSGNTAALALIGPYENLETIFNGASTTLKGMFVTLGGEDKVFQGMSKAGDLTATSFKAMETSISDTNAAMVKAGVDGPTALQAEHAELQHVIDASRMYGYAIDPNTQKLIDQSKAAGLAFKTDPIVQLTGAIEDLVKALGGIPTQVDQIGQSVANLPHVNLGAGYGADRGGSAPPSTLYSGGGPATGGAATVGAGIGGGSVNVFIGGQQLDNVLVTRGNAGTMTRRG